MLAESPDRLAILQVCSASNAVYGAVQSLMTLAREQRARGNRVEFVTFAGKAFGGDVRGEGFPVHEVRHRAKIDPVAILRMRKLMRSGAFDIVHTHLSTSSVNGCLAARIAKIPCVATVHGLSAKMSFAAANHLIGVSKGVKAHLVKQGVDEAKVSVVYNGIPMELPPLNKAEIRASMDIPDDAMVAGTIARVTPKKGIEDALKAIASVPNVYYVVAGDGVGLDNCRDLAKTLGLEDRVRFLGYRADVEVCLAAMDVFLFPSHKEAMGIALVEAMRSSLPLIATETGGIPEVVTPECGFLVPVQGVDRMAASLAKLINDGSERQKMGQAARERALEVFSAESMTQGTEAVYRKLIR